MPAARNLKAKHPRTSQERSAQLRAMFAQADAALAVRP